MERRKHRRFSATAFLNRTVLLNPTPPYFGKALKGKLIDLSGGGLSLHINHIFPLGTKLMLSITFPDHTTLKSMVQVRHMLPKGKGYLHGFEFLTLEHAWVERIDAMSAHYIECDQRIHAPVPNPCVGSECAFFTMCSKPERKELLLHIDDALLLEFVVPDSPPPVSTSTPAA